MGTKKLERATEPWQPLPMTPAMERAALELDEDVGTEEEDEDTFLAQQRMGRDPAFVSSKTGR